MSRSLFTKLALRHDRDRVMSRREALRRSMAGAAAVMLGSAGAVGCRSAGRGGTRGATWGSEKRVIVIGAGFGGLAAAHELLRAGCEVEVVEARPRVGGRVLSFHDMVPGKVVEGGGELIGANHPAWLGYAARFGLTMRDVTEEDGEFPIVLRGEMLDGYESEALWIEMEETLGALNEMARGVDPQRPWEGADALMLDQKSMGAWIEGSGCGEGCAIALHELLTADNGAETSRQSLLANLAAIAGGGFEAYWTDSEVYRCAEGNDALAMKLAEAIGGERIRLGTPVQRIERKGSRVEVEIPGGMLEADEVVLATPPSVWGAIEIEPRLPRGLDRVQMGMNTKHLSVLSRPVWRESGRSPDSLTDGAIQLTWHETDNQEGEDDQRVVMTSFAGGERTAALRRMDRAVRDGTIRAHLESLYPGASEAWIGSRDMDWVGERLTKGSYSFPAPGEVTLSGRVLAEGVGNLHFAGEHCCPGFVGYMEGALESGIRVAERIAARVRETAAEGVAS